MSAILLRTKHILLLTFRNNLRRIFAARATYRCRERSSRAAPRTDFAKQKRSRRKSVTSALLRSYSRDAVGTARAGSDHPKRQPGNRAYISRPTITSRRGIKFVTIILLIQPRRNLNPRAERSPGMRSGVRVEVTKLAASVWLLT